MKGRTLQKSWRGRPTGSFARPSNKSADKSPRIIVALPTPLFALVADEAERRGVSASRVLREICAGHFIGRGDLSMEGR